MSNQNVTRKLPVFFLHIPKTAGSTLNWVIDRQYEPETIFEIYDRCQEESIVRLEEFLNTESKSIKIIKAHLAFGLYGLLPQQFTFRYVTVLRDPVERIISHYYYVLQSPAHYLHHKVTSRKMNLKDYVSSRISTEFDNDQVRYISGVGYTVEFGQCSSEILEIAKKNIRKRFIVVGLTERFDETLMLLKIALQWKPPFYIRQNITQKRPSKKDISKDTLNVIEKYNALDIELYRYAKELFEEQIRRQPASFMRELELFKLFNKFYRKINPAYCSTKSNMQIVKHKVKSLLKQ